MFIFDQINKTVITWLNLTVLYWFFYVKYVLNKKKKQKKFYLKCLQIKFNSILIVVTSAKKHFQSKFLSSHFYVSIIIACGLIKI